MVSNEFWLDNLEIGTVLLSLKADSSGNQVATLDFSYGGLGILNLNMFASALRMRWLWFQWRDGMKLWMNLGTPCTPHDRGEKAKFWEVVWLGGRRLKDIAPLVFDLSKKRSITVCKALENNFWVSQINSQDGLFTEHIIQFINLWEMIDGVELHHDTPIQSFGSSTIMVSTRPNRPTRCNFWPAPPRWCPP